MSELNNNDEVEVELEAELEITEDTVSNDGGINSPFSTKDIKVTNITLALSSLISRLKHEEIDLNPDFQRNAMLWDRKKMSRLVESILLKLPLPVFYFDVSDPDKWIVVDGLQRLSTLKRFIVDKNLRLFNLEFLKELNNKSYEELDRVLKRVIDETQVVTYQIEAQTPKDVRYSIFNRINTGGLSLNTQEIRQALNQKGPAVGFLAKLCSSETFKRVVGISPKRMADRELALRYIAFKFLNEKAITLTDMSSFLDKAMEALDKINDAEALSVIDEKFQEDLEFSEVVFGENHKFSRAMVFEGYKKILNRSLFDVITVCLGEIEDKEKFIFHKTKFLNNFEELLKDEKSEFSRAITEGTSSKNAIETRFSIMRDLIQDVLNG